MPWRETLLMDQRVQFIADYQRDVFNVADLARRYGISRKTAYKWIDRYDGWRPRRPGRSIAASRAFAARHARAHRGGPAGRATAPSDLGSQEAFEGGGHAAADLDAPGPE